MEFSLEPRLRHEVRVRSSEVLQSCNEAHAQCGGSSNLAACGRSQQTRLRLPCPAIPGLPRTLLPSCPSERRLRESAEISNAALQPEVVVNVPSRLSAAGGEGV